MDIEKLTPTQYEIIKELTEVLHRLKAELGYFAALGSWGDTLPEADVLQQLQQMNLKARQHTFKASPENDRFCEKCGKYLTDEIHLRYQP